MGLRFLCRILSPYDFCMIDLISFASLTGRVFKCTCKGAIFTLEKIELMSRKTNLTVKIHVVLTGPIFFNYTDQI